MKAMHPIWLTRTVDDNVLMTVDLYRSEIPSINAPLLKIQPLAHSLPTEPPAAILITSRYAAYALPMEWVHIPIYCVGGATAEAAYTHEYQTVIAGHHDVVELLPRIAENVQGKTLLYLRGEEISVEVAPLLRAKNVHVDERIVYHAAATKQLPAEIRTALHLKQLSGVVFFSARTATIATTLLQEVGLTESARAVDAFCFSLHIASAASALPWRSIHVAHTPQREEMMKMILVRYAAV